MNFHSVAIKYTLGNIRFLAKFDMTARTPYKTCLDCFTIKGLYFLNIIICTSGVKNRCSYYMHVRQKYMYLKNPACFNSYMTLINFPSLYFVLFR